MKISFAWPLEIALIGLPDQKLPDRKAITIAGIVSAEAKIALMAGAASRDRETLSFEADSLHTRIVTKYPGITFSVCSAITYIRIALDWRKINAEVLIDGLELETYASLKEQRLKNLQESVEVAISNLQRTRNWIKDKRFAEIRLFLQEELTKSVKLL